MQKCRSQWGQFWFSASGYEELCIGGSVRPFLGIEMFSSVLYLLEMKVSNVVLHTSQWSKSCYTFFSLFLKTQGPWSLYWPGVCWCLQALLRPVGLFSSLPNGPRLLCFWVVIFVFHLFSAFPVTQVVLERIVGALQGGFRLHTDVTYLTRHHGGGTCAPPPLLPSRKVSFNLTEKAGLHPEAKASR